MPVDFDLLPPAQSLPSPPSRLVWTTVFFVVALIGVFAVLLLWPKEEPVQTPWFWTCVSVYPAGVATFVVLRRYSVYEGGRLDAIAWNNARERYMNEIFDKASRPLSILASGYRFSSDPVENAIDGVLSGFLKLAQQIAPAPDTPPVKARWFASPDRDEKKAKHVSDSDRQRDVLKWLFGELLDDVAATVRDLPDGTRLSVQLVFAGSAIPDNARKTWETTWANRKLPRAGTTSQIEPCDLMSLDTWLDRINDRCDTEVRLLVFVQLQQVIERSPPPGSAEAAVAILLAPPSMIEQLKWASVAEIHRPMTSENTSVDEALAYAWKWGKVAPSDVGRIWQSGLDVSAAGDATQSWVKAGVGATAIDLDHIVGHAGVAAPWLSLACAVKANGSGNTAQLLATGSTDGSQFSIVRGTQIDMVDTKAPQRVGTDDKTGSDT
ncbi:hypothetical protein [Caballeronia humi]|uniref:Uncharacterized protein n=1 Tax=Caballeronia humi TaxID=326474 RepID=A0A158GLR9_9BURK|nr:hypothetical protein [Caballeronia humi]SAL33065.1 hypothetical protein AWB65_02209 [Caballeronia humi]